MNMNTTVLDRPAIRGRGSVAGRMHSTPSKHWGRREEDRQFATMRNAYARTGGLLHADAMTRLMRRHHERPLPMLARWIISREVVSMSYGGQTLIPLFQFEMPSVTPHPNLLPVLQELRPAFDEWELATWFASESEWLGGHAPVDVFATCLPCVLEAARADRFIAKG
ncbi:MAG TPA: hypothetical protein VN680_15810 [Burkholderiaceae bacterium]|nr:hypothetical protein [Burkholderiaceae bacterium]